jgi:hypothetical protein
MPGLRRISRDAGRDRQGSFEAGVLRLFILAALRENDPASAGLLCLNAYGPPSRDVFRYPPGVFVDTQV